MTKVVKYIFSLFVIISITEARSFEEYLNKRKELIEAEKQSFLGAEIELTANEALFNDLLMLDIAAFWIVKNSRQKHPSGVFCNI